MYPAYKEDVDYSDHRPTCRQCEENWQKIDDAAHFLQEVVKQLYSTKDLDVDILEHCLDEMCHILNVKMCPGDIQIERSKNYARMV